MFPTQSFDPETFWMAGYECADHLNKFGDRVNLLHSTGHLRRLGEDYDDLRAAGIGAVREGICWSVVETAPYRYDWTTVSPRMLAARKRGIRQYWDICHFGFPNDLTPLHPHFTPRFAALCEAFVRHYRNLIPEGELYVTPINEISFLSWLGGDACGTAPFCVRQGWEVKYHLCKAFIAGVKAMRTLDEKIVVLSTEPLINVVAAEDCAARLNEEQFQAVDLILGRDCPELGGGPDCIDLIGANFYYNNQWLFPAQTALPWARHDRHPQWVPLHRLLRQLHQRYRKPLLLSETSHAGIDRGLWMQHIAEECVLALRSGVPLQGVCLYPIIDRPDWDFPDNWHRSGLWDEAPAPHLGAPQRLLCAPYLQALQQAQHDVRAAAHDLRFFTLFNTPPMTLTTTLHGSSPALPQVFLCFSHLRWDFVYQRPQHILSRLSGASRIYYIEEPVFGEGATRFEAAQKSSDLAVLVPHLPHGLSPEENTALLKRLVDELVTAIGKRSIGLWYYTPMALPFTRHLNSSVTVFDCMDELSAFRFAPPELLSLEQELLDCADVVFTGGASLYEAKKDRHPNVHLFPSSIDREHFGRARGGVPASSSRQGEVRLGFFGVIDERFDTALLAAMAAARPQWQFEIVGPVVKIDPASLPGAGNIHYTGGRQYSELPAVIRGWDIAMIPFALNESTRFISPTKTPEYLAAGKPVISSPIRDVVHPYGELGLVSIAATAANWIEAAERILASGDHYGEWLARVDAFLEGNSWDATVKAMQEEICAARRTETQSDTAAAAGVLPLHKLV